MRTNAKIAKPQIVGTMKEVHLWLGIKKSRTIASTLGSQRMVRPLDTSHSLFGKLVPKLVSVGLTSFMKRNNLSLLLPNTSHMAMLRAGTLAMSSH